MLPSGQHKRKKDYIVPNEYSIEIHNFLSELIQSEREHLTAGESDKEFHQGRLDELLWIRQHLGDRYDLRDFTYY
jgi:hypothetical protein